MTKQALGELADDLESRGLCESVRDPRDRRVRIIRPTRRGLAAVVAAEDVIRGLEEQWCELLGVGTWDRFRRNPHGDPQHRRAAANLADLILAA